MTNELVRTSGRRRRVAVTGRGVKAPGGCTVADLWSTLRSGRSMVSPISSFDASSLPVTMACAVGDFDPSDHLPVREARRLDRSTQLAMGAGLDAVVEARLAGVDPGRCGVVVGTGLGGVQTLVHQVETATLDPRRLSPLGIPMLMANAPAASLGVRLGWTGPNFGVATACAAGAHAIGEGARLIREGAADVVLTGGTEAAVTPFVIRSLWRMGVLSRGGRAPAECCRPFDRHRDGFVVGEGAGFLLLEEWGRARRRGARIFAELLGYGRNCDASHITAPAPGGAGAAACMQLALADGGLPPSAVAHINAHGTATRRNDECEAEAITKVFSASPPPVTATKSVIGHLLGAAGAVEALATVLAVEHREVPPTANFTEGDPAVPLDVVAGRARPLPRGAGLSNSFGFGGHNASLLFGPGDGDDGDDGQAAPGERRPVHCDPSEPAGERLSVRERLVVSPVAGPFVPDERAFSADATGTHVRAGHLLGRVRETDVLSTFSGRLMGWLVLPGERVAAGQPIAWLRT